MSEEKKLIDILEGEIETRILPNTNYPYVPAAAVRSRLNEAFDCLWDTRIVSNKIEEDNILLRLELSVKHSDNVIKKEGFGSSNIQRYSSGTNKGKPVNIGDAYGNAVMDALKACAKQLGIGNKELDVVKDPDTGMYVKVSEVNSGKKVTIKNKDKQKVVHEESTDETESKKSKLEELKKKIAANKKNKEKELKNEVEPTIIKDKEPSVDSDETSGAGFDYSEIGNKDVGPKNTQKLVIINLAKMQKMDVNDYIEKILGNKKDIDDLTAKEAGNVVRSGLNTTLE